MSETFTSEEIKDGLERRGCYQFVAEELIADIKAHREPKYVNGELYEDSQGIRYIRRSGDTPWQGIYTGNRYADSSVKKPLRKLVPEEPKQNPLVSFRSGYG